MTGLFLAILVADVDVHHTYFVIAHFHYIMVSGMVFRCVLCALCARLDETRQCGQTVCVDWCEPVLAMMEAGLNGREI
jgi:hypothetical protein